MMARMNFLAVFFGMIATTLLLLRRFLSTRCIKRRCCRCCVMDKKVEDVVKHAKLDKKVEKMDNDLMDDILGLLRKRVRTMSAK